MPTSMFFKYERKIALVIGCSDYAELRQIEGKEGFGDLPEAMNDIETVYCGMRRIRFKRNEIKMLRNPNY